MLILVRHGRTHANAARLLQGRSDNELDTHGEQQASQIAAALARNSGGVDRIVSSPLRRATQTAQATADRLGIGVTLDDRWSELEYGEWEALPISEVSSQTWTRWRADPTFAPPGGESLLQLNDRINRACDDLVASMSQANDVSNVVVFTHVSPIKAAVRWALGVDDEVSWRMHVAQAQITRIEIRGGTPLLGSFNETSHLSDSGR